MATAPPIEGLLPRFREDLRLYSAACLKIQTKSAGLKWLEFNEAQRVVHEKITRQLRETGRVRALILKARQEGISTYVAARFFRKLHLWPNTQAVVVADLKKRSGILFNIYDRFRQNLDHLPPGLRPQKKTTLKKQEMAFHHGSELLVETAGDEQAGRAMTIHLLHCSEQGFWEHAEPSWISVQNAVPPEDGSEIIVESTANGVGNLFHRLWKQAEEGNSSWIAIFLPWWIHAEYKVKATPEERRAIKADPDPFEAQALGEGIEWEGKRWRLSVDQLAWRRRIIADQFEGDERYFRQEYPATAREAFLVSGGAFFDEVKLHELSEKAVKPLTRGLFVLEKDGVKLQKASRGPVRIYEPPARDGHYVIGADTAEGRLVSARATSADDPEGERGGRDFCSAHVIRCGYWRKTGERDEMGNLLKEWVHPRVVAEIHSRMAPEPFADQLYAAGTWYSCVGPPNERTKRHQALLGVERNHSTGQTVLRRLRRERKYRRLFWHRRVNVATEKRSQFLGWITSGDTRRPMLDDLGASVRNDTIGIPSAETIGEMLTFVLNDEGEPEAQEGCHDDRCLSLGIAYQMATRHHREESGAGEPPRVRVKDTPTGA